jgi:hypothetical protein
MVDKLLRLTNACPHPGTYFTSRKLKDKQKSPPVHCLDWSPMLSVEYRRKVRPTGREVTPEPGCVESARRASNEWGLSNQSGTTLEYGIDRPGQDYMGFAPRESRPE